MDIDYQAEMLAAKIKHYLITTMGRVATEANNEEFYQAFAYTLREEVMINWLTSARSLEKQKARTLYYLSMEYLPGRISQNNISNLSANEIVLRVMQKMNRNFLDIINCEPDPGLGNGGLGRLASCLLDSLATQHYPTRAYGLRYQYGIFEQQLWNGMQIEAPDGWLNSINPWEFRRDPRRVYVKFCGESNTTTNSHGDEIEHLRNFEAVRAVPYDVPIVGYAEDKNFSVVTLRLWTTKESPRNFLLQRYNAGRLDQAAENTDLTDVLYPCDHHETGRRVRLKQEFLLVSASLQDIVRHFLNLHEDFSLFPEKVRIQVNDTHPALVIAELIRILTKDHNVPMQQAIEITKASTGYTNHTVLREALEQWDYPLMSYLLPRQTHLIEKFNQSFCDAIREKYPNDDARVDRMTIIKDGQFRMANLAIVGSHKVNGVAALHTKILKEDVFIDFYEMFPDKFVNVTNGVTQRRWLLDCNPELAQLITNRIGNEWITNFSEIHKLAEFATDPETLNELVLIKSRNKQKLMDYLYQHNQIRDIQGEPIEPCPLIDIDSLFDVQIKRIHEYKRQLMNILHVIMLYQEILATPNHNRVKRTFFFAGKAAAGYEAAKNIIRFICCVARKINKDPDLKGLLKVIYIEDYSVSKAEMIIPAADLSEQISTAGTEASGTGNMKLTINGALTIGTDDGANIEMREEIQDKWWPFKFGASTEEIQSGKRNESNERIKKAVETLQDRTFAESDGEHEAFMDLYKMLLESHYDGPPDRYFVLHDLEDYYQKQKKVEELYRSSHRWAEFVIHNIAGMGKFSIDRTIQDYNEKIWQLDPCLPDPMIRSRVEEDYREHDKCRIY